MPLRARKNKKIRNSLFRPLNRKFLTAFNMLLKLRIRCLTSCISKHVALSYSDYHATSYLNINGISLEVNTLNCAVNTAACNHLGTLCQSILELADFLLLLLLRTDCGSCESHREKG